MYNLCLCLGFPHPDYLYPYLSGKQLLDWQDFAAQFGFGVDRDDIHWGMLLSMFFNVNRDGGPPKDATEFMPYRQEPEEDEMSDEHFLLSIQDSIAAIKGLQKEILTPRGKNIVGG
jgi:hypothetical protein